MKKQMAQSLRFRAGEVAVMFSQARDKNYVNEKYEVGRIIILSDVTAAVIYNKEPTKKQAVAWFYYINSGAKPRWEYFFVTYSHLVGLNRVAKLLHDAEQHNFEAVINGG